MFNSLKSIFSKNIVRDKYIPSKDYGKHIADEHVIDTPTLFTIGEPHRPKRLDYKPKLGSVRGDDDDSYMGGKNKKKKNSKKEKSKKNKLVK